MIGKKVQNLCNGHFVVLFFVCSIVERKEFCKCNVMVDSSRWNKTKLRCWKQMNRNICMSARVFFWGGGWGEGRRRGCFVLVFSKQKVIVFVFCGVVCLLFFDCLFISVITMEFLQLLPSNMSDSLQLPISLSNKAGTYDEIVITLLVSWSS